MAGTYFSEHLPGRDLMIKVRNQAIYSLYDKSPNKNTIIGKNKNLFEEEYVSKYVRVYPPVKEEKARQLCDSQTVCPQCGCSPISQNGNPLDQGDGSLILSTIMNYIFGLLIGQEKKRRLILAVSVIYNVGILFVFKYLNFFADTVQAAAHMLKLDWTAALPAITLPIGISFFTFQIMSYVIDVYNRKVEVQKNPLDLALYIMLFLQLIAGPIVRYIDVK